MTELSRRAVLQAGVASTAMLLPGVGQAQSGLKPFTFITPFGYQLSFSEVLYAKAGGFFAKEGLDVTVHGGKGAAQAAQLVVANQANSARTGGGNFISAVVKSNAPLVSIATISQISPFSVISSAAKPIAKVQDLAGKTVGLASLGGSMEETLDMLLLRSKIDKTLVKREKVADSPGSFGLVEAGRVDGFFGNASTSVRVKNSGAKASILRVDDGVPGQVFVATPEAVAKDADMLVRFLRGVNKAITALLDAKDLNPILDALGKEYEIRGIEQRETATEDLRGNMEQWTAKGRENVLRNVPEAWAEAIQVMGQAGFLDKSVDATKLYTNALWQQAVKA
jgi:NitT/TauT family transport system substrate-binding protein